MRINHKGMTLIEIMIVIAIIGGLMAILMPNLLDSFTKARVKQSVIQLTNIKMALRNYVVDCGDFPAAEVGLLALIEEPGEAACAQWGPRAYIESHQLKDQFGHKILYDFDGSTVTLTFLGKDGRQGGTGYNKDITVEDSVD